MRLKGTSFTDLLKFNYLKFETVLYYFLYQVTIGTMQQKQRWQFKEYISVNLKLS